MRKIIASAAGILVCVAWLTAPGNGFAETKNSLNVGFAGGAAPDASATVFLAEYERGLSSKLSILGRLGAIDYSYDDGTYVEDGDGNGLDVGVRIYPSGGMKGIYFGGAVGLWNTDWTFTDDKGTFYQTQGKGSSTAVRLDLEVGARIKFGTAPVSLMPSFHLGNYFSVSDDCTYTAGAVGSCSQSSDFNLYAYFGVAAGFSF
jgi:hypothetical protein